MVVSECCCCIPYRLVLMLALTFAPCVLIFEPYKLTFRPCVCGVTLLSTGANIPLTQVVVVYIHIIYIYIYIYIYIHNMKPYDGRKMKTCGSPYKGDDEVDE